VYKFVNTQPVELYARQLTFTNDTRGTSNMIRGCPIGIPLIGIEVWWVAGLYDPEFLIVIGVFAPCMFSAVMSNFSSQVPFISLQFQAVAPQFSAVMAIFSQLLLEFPAVALFSGLSQVSATISEFFFIGPNFFFIPFDFSQFMTILRMSLVKFFSLPLLLFTCPCSGYHQSHGCQYDEYLFHVYFSFQAAIFLRDLID
jgi:hypothetical protein